MSSHKSSFDTKEPSDFGSIHSGEYEDEIDVGMDGDEDMDEETIQVSKEFEENVIKYVQYDDMVRKKTEEISGLKKKRDNCKQFVLDYLSSIGETTIEIDGGKLRRNKFETKQALTSDMIKQSIAEKVGNPQLAEEIFALMEGKRPMKERIDLKRTFARGKKKNPKKTGKAK